MLATWKEALHGSFTAGRNQPDHGESPARPASPATQPSRRFVAPNTMTDVPSQGATDFGNNPVATSPD